jgi:16S rRNA (cytidine1402-2'-O)-methyltransferase
MVATPIGNLADISLRALHTLERVDAVACEDTRHTAQLLQSYGLHKPLLAVHMHNEHEGAMQVIARLQSGQRVAYVSDAGTPGVSDPGAVLVQAARQAGLRVIPLPGASSVTSLISAVGLPQSHQDWAQQGFVFTGFLPAKGTERSQALLALATSARTVVFMEAPHRLDKLAAELLTYRERALTIGRELTKRFESITTLACQDFAAWLAASDLHRKGEFVLALAPLPVTSKSATEESMQRTLDVLLASLPLKTAVQLTVALTGANKKVVYAAALAKQTQDETANDAHEANG